MPLKINTSTPVSVVILAAGLGKRMKTDLPKVLHPMSGLPLLIHIILRVKSAFFSTTKLRIAIVVGHQKELVEKQIREFAPFADCDITFIEQKEQKGTGHALQCVMNSEWGVDLVKKKQSLLVLPGDLPLIQSSMIEELSQALSSKKSAQSAVMRVLTTHLENPTGYGRILRRGQTVLKIVEEKDAKPREKLIKEVATSIYLFSSAFLKAYLPRLSTKNAQGEYYLTDLVEFAHRSKLKIETMNWECCQDLRGINDLDELSQAELIHQERLKKQWSQAGVRFILPHTTYIETQVQLSPGVCIESHVSLKGTTQIGPKTTIKSGSVIIDSTIEESVQIGPYAHLRPQSHVKSFAKIGNFVELKKTTIGEKTSVAHLSYLGDAVVGREVNIGCGFVTCNYDGRVIDGQRKHQTKIEDRAFIGSDCQVVAPITIGEGAYIASGSTITESVEAGALALARSRQINKPKYASKYTRELK